MSAVAEIKIVPRTTPELPKSVQVGLLVAVFGRLAFGLVLGFRPFDDTYITLRYAKNLLAGYGLVFNPGESVLGTTAPMWAVATSGVSLLGPGLEHSAFALALIADAVAFLLMAILLWELRRSASVVVAFSVIFLSSYDLLAIARSGMESTFFSMLALGSAVAIVRARPIPAVLLASLATTTRPEGVLVLAMLALFRLEDGKRAIPLHAWLLGLIPLLAWVATSFVEYGSPVPQSIGAKADHLGEDSSLRRFSWMNLALFFVAGQFGGGELTRSWLQSNWVVSGLAAAAFAGLLFRKRMPGASRWAQFLVFGFVPLAFVTCYAFAGAFTWFPWYYELPTRYGIGLAALGAATIAELIPGQRIHARRLVFAAPVLLILLTQTCAVVSVKWRAPEDRVVEGYLRLTSSIPAKSEGALAALEVGALGWGVWPRETVDLLGLVSRAELKGLSPLARLDRTRPAFLATRVDDAAWLMKELRAEQWFVERCSLCASTDLDGGFELYCCSSRAEEEVGRARQSLSSR
jgi:hypothetical protein